MAKTPPLTFKDRSFTPEEISVIQEVVGSCSGLSHQELANTICELLDWHRPNGGLKTWESRDLLCSLEQAGLVRLPPRRPCGRPRGSRTSIPTTGRADPQPKIVGTVRDIAPIGLRRVEDAEDRGLWRELIDRYHPQGHRVPFGAHLRYLITIANPQETTVGALQLSSPAWRLALRDQWIGWTDSQRQRNLQRIVNHSRFLLVPWVQIKNLASCVLGKVAREVPEVWKRAYGIEPVLFETFVDPSHAGSCYRAANWIALGKTAGRGRQDRHHRREGLSPKQVFVYPLVRNARAALRGLR